LDYVKLVVIELAQTIFIGMIWTQRNVAQIKNRRHCI